MSETTRERVLRYREQNPDATIREIQSELGISAPSVVHYHLTHTPQSQTIEQLSALLKEAVAALMEAEDALDNYADAEIISGHAIGNTAMRASVEVRETLAKLKRALPPPPAQEGE
jgi:DNA-binding Lrp family transcriptional regulator